MNKYNILKITPKFESENLLKETLTRIGIPNRREKVIFPSCYLYEKDGQYYLAHFKQLFLLETENAYDNMTEDDILRRNAIAYCLKEWGLISIDDEEEIQPHDMFIFILPYREKKYWTIKHKFNTNKIYSGNK